MTPQSTKDVARLLSKIDRSGGPDACWPWTGSTNRRGYGTMFTAGRSTLAHRLAFTAANDRAPGPLLVCHHCDNPPCCNPAHLFLGTHTDNAADMMAKGRGNHPPRRVKVPKVWDPACVVRGDAHHARRTPDVMARGSRHGRAKLADADVVAIREMRASGATCQAVADKFGVCFATVSQICTRRIWKHVA